MKASYHPKVYYVPTAAHPGVFYSYYTTAIYQQLQFKLHIDFFLSISSYI